MYDVRYITRADVPKVKQTVALQQFQDKTWNLLEHMWIIWNDRAGCDNSPKTTLFSLKWIMQKRGVVTLKHAFSASMKPFY